MSALLAPSRAPPLATTRPPAPPPITTKSYVSTTLLPTHLRDDHHSIESNTPPNCTIANVFGIVTFRPRAGGGESAVSEAATSMALMQWRPRVEGRRGP